ncbi:MAG: hypothetical protein IJM68_00950 [Synergistaceae bacterium]|nr:hypothetical protein [Synergistaceae bacterium]
MSEKLNPCPFCGEEVEWRKDKEDIYCPACEASWKSIHGLKSSTITTWNASARTSRLADIALDMCDLIHWFAYGSCDDCFVLMNESRQLLARIDKECGTHYHIHD